MKHNETDADTAGRTLWGECRGEPQAGQIAVAWVIRNRAERSRFAGPLAGQEGAVERVCRAKWQFSCWWDEQAPRLKALDAAYMAPQLNIVRAVLADEIEDPTNGADHYHTIAKPGYADVWPPNWAPTMAEVARLGAHVFYDSRLKPGQSAASKPLAQSKTVRTIAATVAAPATGVAAENIGPAIDAVQNAAAAAQQATTAWGAVKDALSPFLNGHVLTLLAMAVILVGAFYIWRRYVSKAKVGDVVVR